MNRINLQLFAQKLNTDTSIVDYLKSQGDDSSYAARKELAASLGISNYSGTAEQNVAMLNALKNGSGASSTPKASSTPTNKNVAGSSISGVDQATIDKMNSSFSASSNVTNAQAEANQYLDKVKEMASVKDIISQDTWDKINTPFQSSTAYQDAMNYTNQLLQQLSSGKTSYTDQIKDLMGQIQNREKFEYDVDSDVLFQQYLASSMASGKTAMQDTIGQASALTGGYGSTYATSAGNQQYNAYIQDAYNNLLEYYQMALEAYQMEGEEMYNQLAMLNQADTTEFQRLYDSWGANFSSAQNMYQNEYNSWRDGVSNAISSAGLQLNEYGQIFDQTYSAYNAVAGNAQTLYQNEYNKWADEVANAYKYAGLANSDYWSTQNFVEEQRQFNDTMTQRQNEFNAEMAYKNSALKQDNDQFYASLAQDQAQFAASLNAKSGSGSGGSDEYSELTNTELKTLEELYVNNGGGVAGDMAVDEHLTLIGKNNLSDEAKEALSSRLSNAELPLQYQNWVMEDDTKNKGFLWWKGDDKDDTYTYKDSTMTFEELKAMIEASDMSEAEKNQMIDNLRKQSTR